MTPLDEVDFKKYIADQVKATGKATLHIIDLDGGMALRVVNDNLPGWQGLLADNSSEQHFALIIFDDIEAVSAFALEMTDEVGEGYLDLVMPASYEKVIMPHDSTTLH